MIESRLWRQKLLFNATLKYAKAKDEG